MSVQNNLNDGTFLYGGKYRILGVLGQGGFGITYLAEHVELRKKFAIKEFFPQSLCNREQTTFTMTSGTANNEQLVAKLKEKFLKEAKFLASLSNEYIVAVHDRFQENGTAYYVMDYIEGETVTSIIKRKGRLSEAEALRYMRQVCLAIKAVHAVGINHLDIKPSNIIVRKEDDKAVLIDFGASKQYDGAGDETTTMAPSFTSGYAPMEQYVPGGVSTFSPQTDIYALGATLYTMLKGEKPPHYSDIFENGLPSLPGNVSNQVQNAVAWAMQGKRSDRPANVDEFVKAFDAPQEVTVYEEKRSMTVPLIMCGVVGAAFGAFVQYFFGQKIFDTIDLPDDILVWFLPIVFGLVAIIGWIVFSFSKWKGGSGFGAACTGMFATLALIASAVTLNIAPIDKYPGEPDDPDPDPSQYISSESYPIKLSGNVFIENLPVRVNLSDDIVPSDLKIDMSEEGDLIIQNSDGYVKASYYDGGENNATSGPMTVNVLDKGSFGSESPIWLQDVADLLRTVSAWEIAELDNINHLVLYDNNGDAQFLVGS